ncbi:hypothetical protein RhiirA4_487412 [Rhizophagus irregularis]|uniref:Uncharacterized protein n=1 Tax=Rhizophagus irregularis TaxID=588596 RepID=A0A2I1HSH7_9GLOM|nr:hypothetical protein RhiirA4_487412 [Rhizophagus irregularis]
MERFWLNSRNIQQSIVTESESFSDEMLGPASDNVVMSNSMLDLLIEYYLVTYETLEYQKPFGEGHKNSRIIPIKIKQFGRCRIGSETFESNMSACHVKNLYVLAKFIIQNGNVDCYSGQIQFFFSHKIDLPDGELEHNLAFIRWYQPGKVIQILKDLDNSLFIDLFDYKKKWTEIKEDVL